MDLIARDSMVDWYAGEEMKQLVFFYRDSMDTVRDKPPPGYCAGR